MNDLKEALNSGLKKVTFSEEMKTKVLEKCKEPEPIVEKSRRSFGKTLVPIIICFALCISVTAATKILLWDDIVAKKYGINSEDRIQEETLNEGLADLVNVSTKSNGITIEVVQTIATNNRLDVYLKVQAKNAEKAKQLTEMIPEIEVTFENALYAGYAGRVESYTEGDNYLIYNLDIEVVETENGLNGDKVYLKIHNFNADSQESSNSVIEGDWDLSWTIRATEQKRTIVFDKEYVIYGKTFKLQKIVMSPTTIQIYLDRELMDEQGLWSGGIFATQKADVEEGTVDGSVSGFIDESFYTIDWRAWCGIPLSIYKNWTKEEQQLAESQIESGTYQGEYIDVEKWLEDEQKVVDPWQITDIRMKNGESFDSLDDSTTIGQKDIEDYYLLNIVYDGYLVIKDVESIRLGNCVIPLEDGIEE